MAREERGEGRRHTRLPIDSPVDNTTGRRSDRRSSRVGTPKGVKYALGVAGTVAILGLAGTGGYALYETGKNANSPKTTESTQFTGAVTTETTGQAAGGVEPKPQGIDAIPTSTTSTTVFEPTTTTAPILENATIGFEGAVKTGDKWSLKNPDGQEVFISLPDGFTPDGKLIIQNDLKVNGINKDLSVYKDWDKIVHEVGGYNYDYNDFSPNPDFKSNVQGDMWAWRVFQGDKIIIPGLGELNGDSRRSVVALFINLQPEVIPWDNEGLGQVLVRHGFTATGRNWNTKTPEKIANTEELLAGHWLFRQEAGTPEKSYIGITDSPDNAKETLFVSFAYRQWGNNPDGTPRNQFQLLRAETVNFGK